MVRGLGSWFARNLEPGTSNREPNKEHEP